MSLRKTLAIRAYGWAKIPLIAIVRPRVVSIDENRGEVIIPLNYITKNHWGAMYFGALSIGADLSGGILAMEHIKRTGDKVALLFKDFKADFLKRADSDVHFVNNDGQAIKEATAKAMATGERVNIPLHITATTPKVTGDEPIAKFILTLSLKVKK
jgi:hypothetical protein